MDDDRIFKGFIDRSLDRSCHLIIQKKS